MGKEADTRTCVIFGGGDVLDYAAVAAMIPGAAAAYAADSGYKHCKRLGLKPELLVGDFDSIGEALPEGIPTLTLEVEKDYTDTALAAEEAVNRGYRDILLVGMAGGRLDHTLANLQTLAGLSRQGINARMTDGVTDTYAFTATKPGDGFTLEPRSGCYFSVLAFTEVCANVTITGGRFPLEGYNLRQDDPRAVSNEFAGREAVITMDAGTALIIVTPK
jgi:thiamine pyrophosphokinase